MENKYYDIDDLIGKYLTGEASEDEIREVKIWLSQGESNQRYFRQMQTIFNKAATVPVQNFNADTAWLKMKEKLESKRSAKTVQLNPSSNINLYLKIAATILIIFGLGYFSYTLLQADTSKPIEVVAEKDPASDTLPDGSGVFLNKETKLAYEFDKKKKTHIVKLKGEAYFNINHDDDKKFIVHADEVFIRDIGTSFNVKAYPESNTIEVVVEEGEVMFYSETDSGVYLRKNGKGIYNKKTKTFTVEDPEPNVTAYKTKFFIFSNTELGTVVETLNEVYTDQITISENLKNCKLTATFNNESTDEMAMVIAETLGLTMKRNGNQVTPEGAGCE